MKSNKNKNYSFIIGILLGFLLSVPVFVYAVTYFDSSEISYDNTTSGMSATTVEEALDSLYAKATIFNQADAQQGNVLSGKKFVGSGGTLLTGTMANKGAVNESVGVGETYTIPAGYHNGSGKVTGPTLSGNAGVGDVLSTKTFYSNNGTIKTGTMPNNGALGGTIAPGGSYTIPAGYTSGGTVTASSASSTVSAPSVSTGLNQNESTNTSRTGYVSVVNGGTYVFTLCLTESTSYQIYSNPLSGFTGGTILYEGSGRTSSANSTSVYVACVTYVFTATSDTISFRYNARKNIYSLTRIA